MKKLKYKLIAVMLIVSLFTVAFASWNILVPTEDVNVNGNINVDEVKDFDNYATVKFTRNLIYNEKGFFKKSTFDPETGEFGILEPHDTFEAIITIDIQKCKDTFDNISAIRLKVSLRDLTGYENMDDVFNNYVKLTSTCPTNVTTESTGLQTNPNLDKYCIYYIPVTQELTSIEIKVSYWFDITNEDDSEFFTHISQPEYRDDNAFDLVSLLSIEYNKSE